VRRLVLTEVIAEVSEDVVPAAIAAEAISFATLTVKVVSIQTVDDLLHGLLRLTGHRVDVPIVLVVDGHDKVAALALVARIVCGHVALLSREITRVGNADTSIEVGKADIN
jgi:hypothetical protein